MPVRLQRRRTKGYHLPPNAVYVGRPTRWGNPWKVGMWNGAAHITLEASMAQYRSWATEMADPSIFAPLRGKDLACWCPLDQPCHADVLLEWAMNRWSRGEQR
jgi:hypothetical protein